MRAGKPGWRWLAGIFAVALILRVGYVTIQFHWGLVHTSFESGDIAFYTDLASSLLSGEGFALHGRPTAWVMPGYPLFLALCYAIVGRDPLVIATIQAIIGALVPLFTAGIAGRLFTRRAAVVAGFLAAAHYELVLWASGHVLTEPLYVCLMSAGLYAFVAGTIPGWRLVWIVGAGVIFGAAALVRPIALLVTAALSLAALIVALATRHGRAAVGGLVFGLACVLVVLPWGLRNQLVLGSFTLVSTEGGHVLWLGNNPAYDRRESDDFARFGGYTPMFPWPPDIRGEPGGEAEIEISRAFRARAVHYIWEHPGLWLARAGTKLWNMWRPTFSGSSLRHVIVAWTIYPLLLALSVTGLVWSWPQRRDVWPLWVFLGAHIVVHAAITGEIRFRLPMWSPLLVLAGAAASHFDIVVRRYRYYHVWH